MKKIEEKKNNKDKKNIFFIVFDLSIIGKTISINIWFVKVTIYMNYDKNFVTM